MKVLLRIEESEDFILNICLSSDRKKEFTKQLGSQAPTKGTIESCIKDSQYFLLPELQLCEVDNSIPAHLAPEEFLRETTDMRDT